METDTSCLPLLSRIGDVLGNALVELSSRCGGHRPSHRESNKERGEVNHDVEDRKKIPKGSTALGRVERERKFRVRQAPERVR